MNTQGLSFDQIPPLKIPLRFYAGAAIFTIFCGLLMIAELVLPVDKGFWISRWNTELIALVHLFTLGVMAQVMLGSLFQLMPVLAGAPIKFAEKHSIKIQLSIVSGVLCLALGFYLQQALLYPIAGVLLAVGLVLFAVPMFRFALQIRSLSQSLFGISAAAAALVITLVSGFLLLGVFSGWWGIDLKLLTDVHASFALLGWGGVLVTVVSFQVIPMFHVTPNFPELWKRFAPATMLLCLLLSPLNNLLLLVLGALLAVQALLAIRLLVTTRRRLNDATRRFWLISWWSLLLSLMVAVLGQFDALYWLYDYLPAARQPMLIGWLILIGFFFSAILGMLLKIGPFLVFLHLQRHCMEDPALMPRIMELPGFNEVLPKKRGNILLLLQIISILSGVIGLFETALMPVAGVIMAGLGGWLLFAVIQPCWRFYQAWLQG